MTEMVKHRGLASSSGQQRALHPTSIAWCVYLSSNAVHDDTYQQTQCMMIPIKTYTAW
jgi:hypothetical protein